MSVAFVAQKLRAEQHAVRRLATSFHKAALPVREITLNVAFAAGEGLAP
jgi:hypothetical protein